MTTDALVTAIQRRLTDISDQQHALAVEKARLVEQLTPLRLGILPPDTAVAQLKAKGVTLHIVQPWAGGSYSWFVDTLMLKQFMVDAQAAEAAIAGGDVTFSPSDHCQFCPANPHSRGLKGTQMCPAMMRMLYPPTVDEDEILGL